MGQPGFVLPPSGGLGKGLLEYAGAHTGRVSAGVSERVVGGDINTCLLPL